MIQRELQYHMRQAQQEKPFKAQSKIIKIQSYRCGPYYHDNNGGKQGHAVPVNDLSFAEPVEVMVGVGKGDHPCEDDAKRVGKNLQPRVSQGGGVQAAEVAVAVHGP